MSFISYTLTLKPNLNTESAKLQAHYILYTQFALDTLKTNCASLENTVHSLMTHTHTHTHTQ